MTQMTEKFPHDNSSYQYSDTQLKTHWQRLHLGDCEPFPSLEWVTKMAREHTALEIDDSQASADSLQQAWRHYHAGEFSEAAEIGDQLGVIGSTVSNKARGIYANYMIENEDLKRSFYETMIERAELAIEALPDYANAHYFHAFALGRYSQSISIGKALAQGLGGKIQKSLAKTLALEPNHAEAHTAMGLYHAEIIDKIGAMVGGLTYGAKKDTGIQHFQRALELTSDSAIALMEYGNGLMMMYGDKKYDDASEAYEKAAAITPVEAMEKLDQTLAASELEEE